MAYKGKNASNVRWIQFFTFKGGYFSEDKAGFLIRHYVKAGTELPPTNHFGKIKLSDNDTQTFYPRSASRRKVLLRSNDE